MPHTIATTTRAKKHNRLALFLGSFLILALLLAACGGAGIEAPVLAPPQAGQAEAPITQLQTTP